MNLKALLIVLIVFSLVGCEKQRLPTLSTNATIVAFGDSLTYGVGAGKNQSYPARLQEISGFTVINTGISGETTAQGRERFQQVLDQHSPELLILMEGGNDILRNVKYQVIRANLAAMIEMAQAAEISVILIGVPEKKLFSDSAPFYAGLAEQYDLIYSDELLADLLRSPQYKSDPIHLNAAGYQLFAESVYQLMKQSGAVAN